MKKYLVSFLKLAVSLGIGIGIVYLFIGKMSAAEKQQVIDAVKSAKLVWVIVPPVLGLLSNYFRTQRWRLLLRPLGYTPGLFNTFLSVMMMYFLNLFFPRLGEVSRCGVLARYEDVPLDKAIGTMVLERIVDVLCLGIILLVLVTTQYARFWQMWDKISVYSNEAVAKYNISPAFKYGVLAGVFVAIAVFIAFQVKKHGLNPIVETLKERAIGVIRGIISIKDIGNPWEFVFHTVMLWTCYFGMSYLAFYMFAETENLPLMAGLMCLAFGAVAFSLTPGGLGLFPIFTTLTVCVYLSTDPKTDIAAISLGWVVWAAQTASVLAGGALSLLLLAIFNREPSLNEVSPKT